MNELLGYQQTSGITWNKVGPGVLSLDVETTLEPSKPRQQLSNVPRPRTADDAPQSRAGTADKGGSKALRFS